MKFVKKQLHLECLLEDLIQLEVSLWTMTTSATWRSTTLSISVKNGNRRLHTKETLSANWFALCSIVCQVSFRCDHSSFIYFVLILPPISCCVRVRLRMIYTMEFNQLAFCFAPSPSCS
ncbi:hypothetical protein PVK06_015332 [Gossypium arboreum]|uniref:Uncharacterized protein n=1 Tax=Gossypium arboreum TaxID=29729 RepID=A0ABR0PWY3_GOSAR|nr:hypothetical protein PVK06_015332 [Gossypium arboreum]